MQGYLAEGGSLRNIQTPTLLLPHGLQFTTAPGPRFLDPLLGARAGGTVSGSPGRKFLRFATRTRTKCFRFPARLRFS